jgi:hypothetical protein
MLIHKFFFQKHRHATSDSRRRRPRPACQFQWESLENRTPLSSGLAGGVEPPVNVLAVEVGLFALRVERAVEWAILEADGAQPTASPTLPANLGIVPATSATGLDPATNALLLAGPGAFVEPLANASSGDTASLIQANAPGASLDPGAFQATIDHDIGIGPTDNPLLNALGQVTNADGPLADNTNLVDHFDDQADLPFFPESGPGFPMGQSPARAVTPANTDDEVGDMSYAGALETIDSNDSFVALTTTTSITTGRAPGRAMSFLFMDLAVQPESSAEVLVPGTGLLTYLATGGRSIIDSELSGSIVDEVPTGDDIGAEPVLPASITAGGISLNVLLGGPDLELELRSEPGSLEQVVELVPLPETSLALAATLWSVPTDLARAGSSESEPLLARTTDATARPGDPSAWAQFVIGTEPSMEQACRDIRNGITAGPAWQSANETLSDIQDERLDWQGPILPAARAVAPACEPGSPRPGRTATLEPATLESAHAEENAQPDSSAGSRVVVAAMPMLSVVSISTMIAGWFWRKRQGLTRLSQRRKQ